MRISFYTKVLPFMLFLSFCFFVIMSFTRTRIPFIFERKIENRIENVINNIVFQNTSCPEPEKCNVVDVETIPKCYKRLENDLKQREKEDFEAVENERAKIFSYLEKQDINYTTASDSLKFFFEKYHPDHKGQHWGGKGTPLSGPGSSLLYAISTRCQLTKVVEEFDIDLIIDISCGDFNWMNFFMTEYREKKDSKLRYLGSDIVEPLINFHQQEYQKQQPEQLEFIYGGDISDSNFWSKIKSNSKFFSTSRNKLILCRHTLQHNFMKDAMKALQLIHKESMSQFLFMTNRVFTSKNDDTKEGDIEQRYFHYNYFLEPFYLPIPEIIFFENSFEAKYHQVERNIPNTLWKLPFSEESVYKKGFWKSQ